MRITFYILLLAWIISQVVVYRQRKMIGELERQLEEKESGYVMLWQMDESCFRQLEQSDMIQLRRLK